VQDISGFTGALGGLYGGGLKYRFFASPDKKTQVSLDVGFETFSSSESGRTARYVEYGAAVIVSNQAGNFTPFGGIRFSDAEVALDDSPTYEADKHIGVFGGIDYFVNLNVFFTGEIHIFDENSLFLGVGYNF